VITTQGYKQFNKNQNIISVVFLFVRKIINLTSYNCICVWHVPIRGAQGERSCLYILAHSRQCLRLNGLGQWMEQCLLKSNRRYF